MPVEVRSSSAWGSNVIASACSMVLSFRSLLGALSVDDAVGIAGPREHELADPDRHEDHSEDEGRGEEDAHRAPLELQMHEVESDEHRLHDGERDDAARQH